MGTRKKQESQSYATIAQTLQTEPAQILFLSDVVAELDAAQGFGMKTYWLVRDNAPSPTCSHPQVKDFDAITF